MGSFYNNPLIGQGFANLAGMFAPPSASDTAAYAAARATQEKAQRLASLFAEAKDFDQRNIAAGNYNPTQSYYAVGVDDATKRYGIDTGAATSRANNAADNARALQERQMQEAAAMQRQFAQPVIVGAGQTAFIPAPAQAGTGLGPVLSGVLNAGQGDTVFTPGPQGQPGGGQVFKGAAKPLTEDQVVGALLGRAVEAGQLTPADAAGMARSKINTETIMDPATGQPRIVSRADAIGQQPVAAAGAGRLEDGTAVINGRAVPVTRAPQDRTWRTQDGSPIPPDAPVTRLGQPTGTPDQFGPTKTNQSAAVDELATANYALQRINDYRTILQQNPGVAGIPGRVRGLAQDLSAGINEMIVAFGDQAGAQVVRSAEDARALADSLTANKGYDPAIKQAAALALELAYLRAKVGDPGGEVNVREMEMFLGQLDGGIAGNTGVLATLDEMERGVRSQIQTRVGTLRDPNQPTPPSTMTAPPAAPAAGGATERWERGPDGKLRKVQ